MVMAHKCAPHMYDSGPQIAQSRDGLLADHVPQTILERFSKASDTLRQVSSAQAMIV